MPLETATHIASLNSSNPAAGDQLSGADDHLRLIKSVLLTDFANITGAVTATHTELNAAPTTAKNLADIAGGLTTAGTSTAYTLTTNTVFASFAAMNGKAITFIPHATSGATPTLNVDGLGAVSLKTWSGVSIPTGALVAGGRYTVTYASATTEFVVHGILNVFPSSAFSGGVTIQTGGLLVTAGGIIVTAGGATVTAGGLTVTSGGLTVSANGAAITGNSTVTGTLGVSSDFAVNTNKFTSSATTGDAAIAGGLAIAGALAVTGDASAGSVSGSAVASQAEQETGSATNKVVTSGRQHYHPSAAKMWGHIVGAGTPSISTSYNLTSITDTATGRLTVTIATDFSSSDWAFTVAITSATTANYVQHCSDGTQGAGSIEFSNYNTAGALLVDPNSWNFAGFGDQ